MAQIFDGYRFFKYLMENILTDGYCLSLYTCKRCIAFKQFDGLNFDGLAGKHQKRQNFPRQNFALYGKPYHARIQLASITVYNICNVLPIIKLSASTTICNVIGYFCEI